VKRGAGLVVPPSGAVAAVIQRVDRLRGVWKAPANEALAQVVKPEFSVLQAQAQALLSSQGSLPCNLIRSFPGRGVRVWGCRTLLDEDGSPWRYLQVRRLLSYIENRLRELGRFCVFEPNNEITWLKLKSLFRSVLSELWLRGALYGRSEEEAFRLYVGLGESMTQDDIMAGRLIFRVELAALYPAEFLELSLRFNVMEGQEGGGAA
ncbi:MAG: phage tail sheath subtilisin-like domain-containing protein, partial [Burkholderiales bacterium]|nr:phage tail sheath subtilisin-like domain-containing protein [Burkholderiales bacterium]